MAERTDGSVIISTALDTGGLEKGLSKINGSIKTLGSSVVNLSQKFTHMGDTVKRIGGLIAGAFAVSGIAAFAKEAIDLGSDLTEVQNVVDSVFTHMSSQVDGFAQSAARAYGLSETMAKRYTGTFGAMAKAFGFTEQEAFAMSTTLTGLAGDVASFYNIDQDAAYTKLKSVFSGETESLKDLGIVMTQTALDEYALANGFGKTTKKMSEQEKVALRYRFILDQLSTASGDFEKTSDGWANQVRILNLQMESLKASIGQGLINLFTPMLKLINALIGRMGTLANSFKAFTELITGRYSKGNASTGLAGLASEGKKASDSQKALADSVKKAGKAVKKASEEQDKYMSGLDEMRRWQTVEATDVSGSDEDSESLGDLGDLLGLADNVDYGHLAEGSTIADRLGESFSRLADLIMARDWEGIGSYMANGLNRGIRQLYELVNWDRLGPTIAQFTGGIAGTINSFVSNFDAGALGRTLGAMVNTAAQTVNSLMYRINWDVIGKKLAEGFNGLLDETDFYILGLAFISKFSAAWKLFIAWVTAFEATGGFEKLGKKIAEFMNGMMDGMPPLWKITVAMAKLLNGAFKILKVWIGTFKWSQFGDEIVEGLNKAITTIDWEENGQVVESLLDKLDELLLKISNEGGWEEFGEGVGTFLSQIDWVQHLEALAHVLWTVLSGIFKGLGKSSAGRLLIGLISFKITYTMIKPFIGGLTGVIGGDAARSALTQRFTSLIKTAFSKSVKAASEALGDTGSSALGVAGFGALFAMIAQKTNEWVETMRGGNGVLTEFGGAVDTVRTGLVETGGVLNEQLDVVFSLKEQYENGKITLDEFAQGLDAAGITQEQFSDAVAYAKTQTVLTTEAEEKLADVTARLGEAQEEAGAKTAAAGEQISFAGISGQEAFDGFTDVLRDVQENCSSLSDNGITIIQNALAGLEMGTDSAGEAWARISGALSDAGYTAEEIAEILKNHLPQAVTEGTSAAEAEISEMSSSTSADLNEAKEAAEGTGEAIGKIATTTEITTRSVGTQLEGMTTATVVYSDSAKKAVEEAAEGSRSATEDAMNAINKEMSTGVDDGVGDWAETWEGVKSNVEDKLSETEEATKTHTEDIAKTVTEGWGSTETSTSDSWLKNRQTVTSEFNQIKTIMSRSFRELESTAKTWKTPLYNAIAGNFSTIAEDVESSFGSMSTGVTEALNSIQEAAPLIFQGIASGIGGYVNQVADKLNSLIDGAQNAQNAIADLLSFDISISPDVARMVGWDHAWLSVPHKWSNYRVPYLATGAVIPPNAPFVAVLGDQKRGNNIEAPEDLIRKIVREEAGGKGGDYRFTIQVNRKTIFDETIAEARLRQMQTGRNPFELT